MEGRAAYEWTTEDLNERVRAVLERHEGMRRSIVAREIAASLGLRGRAAVRQVAAAVEALRQEGMLICATTVDGYWVPANVEEWRAYGKRLRDRAVTLLRTVRAQEQAARVRFGVPEEDQPVVQLELDRTLDMTAWPELGETMGVG